MKKNCFILLLFCLLTAFPALAETAAEGESEWTVLFYYCGADLESHHGFASEDFVEIQNCLNYSIMNGMEPAGDDCALTDSAINCKAVNVVMETGGSKKWDNEKSGLPVSAAVLQRWSYTFSPAHVWGEFTIEQELPLQSMADPETLSDFIRWGTNAYPAKKYALVLWGHGDGAKTGIFVDELFDNDVMRLDELRQALMDGGVFFEAVLLDACLMANLETATAIRHNAAWMIASEEMVPGQGTAVSGWLH